MTSRTMVAKYVASSLLRGDDRAKITKEAAAWLKDSGKTRQAPYLVQDIAVALAESGYMFVHVTTAHPISAVTRHMLETYLETSTNATKIETEYEVDNALIGGVFIRTPYGTLDASVRARLAKIIEGASR